MRRRSHRSIGAVVAAAALMFGAIPLLAPATAASSASPSLNPPIQWSAFNTGHVSVVFPGSFPQVELYENSNASVRAVLQIDGVFELIPGGLPRPTILADAFPTASAGFNQSSPANLSSEPLTLSAALEVRTSATALWGSSGPAPAAGADLGAATIAFRYSVLPSGPDGSGVRVNWTVANWPWVSPTDLLGIEFHFTAASAPALAACTSSVPAGSPTSGCSGESLPVRTILWDSSLTRLEGVTPSGPVASIAWGDGSGAPATPYSVGAMATENGSAEVLLTARAAPALGGAVDFTLATPASPPSVSELRGSGVAYLATLAVVGGAAALLVLLYRRRSRRLLAEL